jgi:hypothetical protein
LLLAQRRSNQLLSKVALLHERYFETEFYEDSWYIFELLWYSTVPYDLIASGRLRYANPEMQKDLDTLSRTPWRIDQVVT